MSDMVVSTVRALASLVFFAGLVACAAPVESETEDGAQAQTASDAGAPAAIGFMCECKATAPGVENAKGIKECAYACDCSTLHTDAIRPAGRITVGPMESEAYSWESWDAGSRICHGQYAYRPTLSSPNWQIQVKFSSFKLTHVGYVSYANPGDPSAKPELYTTEVVQSSQNVSEELRRTAKAPEVTRAIAQKLGVTLPSATSR